MANPPIHDHSYRQYLLDKKLMGSRCTGCGAQYVPPRDVCAACHEGAMDCLYHDLDRDSCHGG
jgi:uncharacterized OB-fold protein